MFNNAQFLLVNSIRLEQSYLVAETKYFIQTQCSLAGNRTQGGSRRVPPMRVHRSNHFERDEVTLITNEKEFPLIF